LESIPNLLRQIAR